MQYLNSLELIYPRGVTLPKLMSKVFVLLQVGNLGTKEFLNIITRAIIFLVG